MTQNYRNQQRSMLISKGLVLTSVNSLMNQVEARFYPFSKKYTAAVIR